MPLMRLELRWWWDQLQGNNPNSSSGSTKPTTKSQLGCGDSATVQLAYEPLSMLIIAERQCDLAIHKL